MSVAFVTGVTGMDGAHLAELLLGKGYAVHGLVRRTSSPNLSRISGLLSRHPHGPEASPPYLRLWPGDLCDERSIREALIRIQPDEVYNLGAQSDVRQSFDMPAYTVDVVGNGAWRMFSAVRDCCPHARVYQASSSEQFGSAPPPQSEATPFHPCSPYGCAKVLAHHGAVHFREAYGLWISCGILFNHESVTRGEEFLTRKVTRAAGRIRAGTQRKLRLGNLAARRDWGWAPEYARAMWTMLQGRRPDDFVVGSGESHTAREFVEAAFAEAGLDWREHVEIDESLYRPREVDHLQADATKARLEIGWTNEVGFAEIVRRMSAHDMALAEAEARGGAGCRTA